MDYSDNKLTKDFEARIQDEINRHYEAVTVTRVDGCCPYGHAAGQTFRVTTMNSDGLCGSLYGSIHPSLAALHYGGSAPWEHEPDSFTARCPESGKVEVRVKRVAAYEHCLLQTGSPGKSMIGKGFPGIDTYRVVVEILDIAHVCTWGHRAEQRFEIDHFNVGGLCGYLYWSAYRFMNLLYAGGGVPWEAEPHIIHSVCPDIYNQTAYRLIREERSKHNKQP